MTLDDISKAAGILAFLISSGNGIWFWISRPAHDIGRRVDSVDGRIDTLADDVDGRIDVTLENLKAHDRRIQRVEDDLRHLPTKNDLHNVEQKVVAIKTELDMIARVVNRIDDFLRAEK